MGTSTLKAPNATITIARNAFLEGLQRVGLVAARGDGRMPVLKSVHIVAEGVGLRLTATDFDRVVSVLVPCDGADEFPTRVVPCHRMIAILAQIPVGTVSLVPIAGDGIRISAGRAKFDVLGMAVDEFPLYGAGSDRATTSTPIDAPTFLVAVARASVCVSTAESRPILTGVHIKAANDERLTIEATDGHQLTREWVERASGPALDLILPAPTVAVLSKAFAGCDALTLEYSDNRAVFAATSGARVETKLVEGPFPNVDAIIPKESKFEATIDRVALLGAIKRVAALSSDDKHTIRLTWEPGSVTVQGVGDTDAGTAEDVVACEFSGTDPFRIRFAARLITTAVTLRTADTIRIGLASGNHAITLRDDRSTAIQHLVMPLLDLGD